jgi:hypothetical protein
MKMKPTGLKKVDDLNDFINPLLQYNFAFKVEVN